MMKTHRLISVLLALSASTAFANMDECDTSHRWWVNLGAGVGAGQNNSGAAAQLSFNGMLNDDLFLNISSTAAGKEDKDIHDLALMLGYRGKHPNWYWSASTGIAYYHFEDDNYWSYKKENGAGLPVQGQLFYAPYKKHWGIGLIGHAVASNHPYAALLLGIQVS